jgi:hypothetical protein
VPKRTERDIAIIVPPPAPHGYPCARTRPCGSLGGA